MILDELKVWFSSAFILSVRYSSLNHVKSLKCHCLCVSAATSLISAIYSILRSLIALSLLYGFCFGALKVSINGGVIALYSSSVMI